MDLKSLGYEVRESRIEGILREIKDEISKKDVRFIKMLNRERKEVYININEIITFTERDKTVIGNEVTEIKTTSTSEMVLATVDEVLRAIEKARIN
jgi:hypothetical protein|nr:MAG TPA: hypothetical protein [Caudoviricetes sp.]